MLKVVRLRRGEGGKVEEKRWTKKQSVIQSSYHYRHHHACIPLYIIRHAIAQVPSSCQCGSPPWLGGCPGTKTLPWLISWFFGGLQKLVMWSLLWPGWSWQGSLPAAHLGPGLQDGKGRPYYDDAPYIWALPVWVGGSLLKFACLPGLRGGREPDSGWGRCGWTPSLGSSLSLTDLKYPYGFHLQGYKQ